MRSSHTLALLVAASALSGCVPAGRGALRAGSHAALEPIAFDR